MSRTNNIPGSRRETCNWEEQQDRGDTVFNVSLGGYMQYCWWGFVIAFCGIPKVTVLPWLELTYLSAFSRPKCSLSERLRLVFFICMLAQWTQFKLKCVFAERGCETPAAEMDVVALIRNWELIGNYALFRLRKYRFALAALKGLRNGIM